MPTYNIGLSRLQGLYSDKESIEKRLERKQSAGFLLLGETFDLGAPFPAKKAKHSRVYFSLAPLFFYITPL